jgi:predicted transposase/invertase (TIGR01784 family)
MKIPSLSYNAMFKAVISNNKIILSKLVEAILDYWNLDIDIKDKELIVKNNELPLNNYKDKQLICDYIIKLSDTADLNIEINKSNYPGLVERNMTYSFKIFYEHFKTGDNNKDFNRYNLLQVNFNNYNNGNDKRINKFLMIDTEDVTNTLSKNIGIMNIDIASCYKFIYNNNNKEKISNLERLSAMVYCSNLEDISFVLGDEILNMEEKKKLINSIKEISKDKEIQENLKLEDNIEYRFSLVEEDAFERGTRQGIEQGISQGIEQGISQGIERGTEVTLVNTIKSMLKKSFSYEDISDITGKSIEEIKKIEKSMKD